MKQLGLYWVVRALLRTALGFYFRRMERFHAERVPASGPVFFTSNHPNSIMDAFVIGASMSRKLNFVATVQVFRFKPLAWLLLRCGVIPVNRMKDDPRAMRSVLETFEACFRVLERGEAIAIFPEGVTHDDPQLKQVKTGTARMALEVEHRHQGKLGLQIVPVGLTFSGKEIYRSDALVHFGEPIAAADYLAGYPEHKHEAIQKLTGEMEQRIRGLMLHLPQLERARIVEAVKRLYLERLKIGNRVVHEPVPPRASELLLTQAIAAAVNFICNHQPNVAETFVIKLDRYERLLGRLQIPEQELAAYPESGRAFRLSATAALGLLLLPIAIYGGIHRFAPAWVIRRVVHRVAPLSERKPQVSLTAVLAGIVSFGLFYSAFVAVFFSVFGWPATLWYALSLPVASLTAYYFGRNLKYFAISLRSTWTMARARSATNRLLALRTELIADIESARWQVPADALPGRKTTLS